MREARQSYRITNANTDEINRILALVSDRIDELEGRRGTPQFKNNIDMGLNKVTSMQSGSDTTDGATVTQVDTIAQDVGSLSDSTSGVSGLVASATPGANRIVMSPKTSQYLNSGWRPTYKSSQQDITSAGPLTLAHGFASVDPTDIHVDIILVNQTAEGNYSVGDVTPIANGILIIAGGQYGVQIIPDATNLNIRYGSNVGGCIIIGNKTTGVGFQITNGNWKAIFRAWVL